MKPRLEKGISGKKKKSLTEQSVSFEEVERYSPSPDEGLSSSQVERRKEEGCTNVSVEKASKTIPQIILSNVFTYFNMIFFILAIVLLVEKSYNNLTFLGVVFINTAIGIIQEIRAKKTLEKLTLVSSPLTKVIRNGQEISIRNEELVLDDIVIFEAGNQICADAVIIDGEVNVNESLVTGEADEIKKTAGADLLSGSFVISGRCRARLDKVGYESFASKLMIDAKKIKKQQRSGMMKSLTLLIKIIGVVIIPFSVIMFINQYSIHMLPVKDSIENTAASIIGMIPEGLYLLASIALVVSVMRLAKQNTLVHDMKCIETLARVNVICVDKTGTITEPEMHVKETVSLEAETKDDQNKNEDLIREVVMNMTPDNNTMKTLQNYFDDKKSVRQAEHIKGFSSKTKYSAVAFDDAAYVLGAPEFILFDEYESWKETVESHSSAGERVLLFAEYRYEKDSAEDIFNDGSLSGTVVPLALVILENRVRPEAKETFGYFTEQGVNIKVISGDNPVTVSKVAEEAGIPGAEKYIDATTLDTDDKISRAVNEYNVFGRVTPEQKRSFVKALKKSGHTVAMTGDGVNDVLALKDADCSIAMASGSDAAANVSDLVLLDSDFSSMPLVVAEGRRVINNIQRSASLFLMKNIFSFILTLITIVSVAPYPFKPAQLSLISAVMIGLPSFLLALEPNTDMVKGKFLRNVLRNASPAAITSVILVGWSLLFSSEFNISMEYTSVTAFYLYAFAAYLMLFKVCHPMTFLHKLLFASMGVLFVLAVGIIPEWFNIIPLSRGSVLILITLMLLAVPVNKVIQKIFDFVSLWYHKIRDFISSELKKRCLERE